LCVWVTGLVYAADRTIQSHAYALNNSHGIFMVLIMLVSGVRLFKAEFIGLALAIIGILCLAFDPSALRKDGASSDLFVCLVDLGSAVFGAFYFILSAKNVKQLPMCTYLLV
jgi:hypothetical protein